MALLTCMLATDTRAGEQQVYQGGNLAPAPYQIFFPQINRGEFQGCVEITENTTWTQTGSPYLVSCDVFVAPEVMLTIEAGVTVQFEHPEDEILIGGMLQAVGTQAAPIIFEPISGTVSGSWGRLLFYEGSTGLLDHTVLEYGGSYRGMLYIASNAVQVLNSVVQYSLDTGIFIQAASPLISATQILSNTGSQTGGGMYINTGSPTIVNNLISGNSIFTTTNISYGGGIGIYSGTPLIQNNIISGNHSVEGGGIYIRASDASILNNTLDGNSAATGGGLWNAISNPVIEHNTIISNTAVYEGGGLYNEGGDPYIGNNTFISNTAEAGGGINILEGAPTIFTNTFSSNVAVGSGGGLLNQFGLPNIQGNTFSGNRANLSGGGIYIFLEGYIIQHNAFTQNTALGDGGGLYIEQANPYVWDNTFTQNSANQGGGMYIYNNNPNVQNNIFSGNHAVIGGGLRLGVADVGGQMQFNVFFGNTSDQYGGGMYVECDHLAPTCPNIYSNIVISNTSSEGGGIYFVGDNAQLDYNDVWGNTGGDYFGIAPGAHDISADPRLVDPTTGDFHLTADSPCIDKAHPSEYPPTDFDGEVRPNGPAPDIGPDEFYARMD